MDKFAKQKLTKERHALQTCKTYEVKVDNSKLSENTIEHLSKLFIEAKWFYNYCLGDINIADTTIKTIPVKVGDQFENRDLIVLKSGMKQAIKTRLFNNINSLSALKTGGYKVGQLKFKNKINSIPLKQLNNTFYIKQNSVRIQGMKQNLRVAGLEQIPKNAEITNAVLLWKADGFYVHITTFQNIQKTPQNTTVGIDFGCQTQLAFSNGIKVEFEIPVSKRLKKIDRKIKRRELDSKNASKDRRKRQREYQKITNKKTDIRHKIVSAVTKEFKYVCFQDENISAWQCGKHGKKVFNSAIGGILSDLKHKSVIPIEVDKFFPSTQICPKCGNKHKIDLSERVYQCVCGFSCDRDIKSAICIKMEGLKQIPTEHRQLTLGETSASTFLDTLVKINGIAVKQVMSLSQEASF